MYAIIDIEATGGSPKTAAIIEIAIFKFNGIEIIDQFISLVSTDQEIDFYVQKLTGITAKMIKRSPKFHELAKRIIEITENCVLVGHGINFDYQILKKTFKQLGYDYEKTTLDTLPFSKDLFPGEASYSLGKLCQSIGIPLSDRHRAAGDARATVDLLGLLLKKDVKKNILKKHCIEKESNQTNRINKAINSLPEEVGLFYFLDKKKEILYASASENIRLTVTKTLQNPSDYLGDIKNKVLYIEYERTHNLVIALLKLDNNYLSITKKIIFKNSIFSHNLYAFGVYKKQNDLFVEYIGKNKPYIVFNQLSKANEFIDTIKKSSSIRVGLNKLFSLKNALLVGNNLVGKDKFFLIIKNNKIYGYGFFSLYNQIYDVDTLEKLTLKCRHNNFIMSIIRNYIFTFKFEKIINL